MGHCELGEGALVAAQAKPQPATVHSTARTSPMYCGKPSCVCEERLGSFAASVSYWVVRVY